MPDPTIKSQSENVAQWIKDLPLEPGDSTQPERFSSELLDERRAKIGPAKFDLHYRLDCSLADVDKYPLRLADLIVLDVDPEMFPAKIVWANGEAHRKVPSFGMSGDMIYKPMYVSGEYIPYTQTCVFVDPSGRGKDETGLCVASLVNGYIVVHELVGLEGGYDEPTLEKIAKYALQYNANQIHVESNFGDGTVAALLRPVVGRICGQVGVEEYRVSGMKEARMISNIEPVMAAHRLVFNTKAIREEPNQIQLTRLTDMKGALKHDDRVDVLSAACDHWRDGLQVDVDEMAARNIAKAEEDYIQMWVDDSRRGQVISDARGGSGTSRVTTIFGNNRPKRGSFLRR